MITKNYPYNLIHFSPYPRVFRRNLFQGLGSNLLRIHRSKMSLLTNFKSNLEDILYLSNPILIVSTKIPQQNSFLSSLDDSTSQSSLVNLALKPSLKLDKKIKKNDKDDDREGERLKLKSKKKVKSKVSFDEDYDSVNDFLEESETLPDKSFLPLARPPKPISSPVTASSHLKQAVVPITSRKKKIGRAHV